MSSIKFDLQKCLNWQGMRTYKGYKRRNKNVFYVMEYKSFDAI